MALNRLLFWILLALAFGLACVQGYWRHDAWIYTDSELHEIGDGKWLAHPFHQLIHGIPPELSLLACLVVLAVFLRAELTRIGGVVHLPGVVALIVSLSMFSPSVLSQLQWPTHALAACVPLLLSLRWQHRQEILFRVWRSFVVCFGSLSILSSFAFFAPLCLLPSGLQGKRAAWRDGLVVVLATPGLLVGSYGLVSLIKRLYVAFGVPTAPGRLEAIGTIDYLGLGLEIASSLQLFLLRQWGQLASLIPMVLMVLGGWALVARSRSALVILFVALWILLVPILSVVASGTGWQRVAVAWCALPPLLALVCVELKPKLLKWSLFAALVTASVSSAWIGFYNATVSALATRAIANRLHRQLELNGWQQERSRESLVIVDVEDVDTLSPRFIWGGWPAFAISNPENVRFHRVFNELGVAHYVVRHGSFFFHPDVPTRLALTSALQGQSAGAAAILDHYNCLSGARLPRAVVLHLPKAGQH